MTDPADDHASTRPLARQMFELIEPIGSLPFGEHALAEVVAELGLRTLWDGYFAGRAAALGAAPAEVVHAVFYNFFPGEVARHIPRVWELTTPEAAFAARDASAVRALERGLGGLADTRELARAADLLARAAVSAPTAGRPMYAALHRFSMPEEPLARLFRAATLLREHRGDGHNAVLVAHGIGGPEAHFLTALDLGVPGPEFGRVSHRPAAELAAIAAGLHDRGLIDRDGGFTPAGRQLKDRIEAVTDQAAQGPFDILSASEIEELTAGLESVSDSLASPSGT